MTTQNKHSALPWRIIRETAFAINIGNDKIVAGVIKTGKASAEEKRANAEFITRCCNSHYDLVEALRNMLNVFEEYGEDFEPNSEGVVVLNETKVALARATGKEVA